MARPKSEIITPWELRLLQAVWQLGQEASAVEIGAILKKQGMPRSNSAVRKTLRILVDKGVLGYKKKGKRFIYHALMDQEKVTRDCIQYVSRLLFGGSWYQLALQLFDENELTEEFLQEMKKN